MATPPTISRAEFDAFQEEQGNIKKAVEGLESNWDKDRTDYQEQKNKFSYWETQMKINEEMMLKLPDLIKEKVEEATKELREEVSDLREVIESKKMIAVDKTKTEEQIKKPWWKFGKG